MYLYLIIFKMFDNNKKLNNIFHSQVLLMSHALNIKTISSSSNSEDKYKYKTIKYKQNIIFIVLISLSLINGYFLVTLNQTINNLNIKVELIENELTKQTNSNSDTQPNPNLSQINNQENSLRGKDDEQGAKGERGSKGEKGEKGERGRTGDKGETGEQGSRGEKGSRGETGEQGSRGEKGASGKDADPITEEDIIKIINKTETGCIISQLNTYNSYKMIPGISDIGRSFDPRSWTQGASILDQTFNDKLSFMGEFNKITYRVPDFIGQNIDGQASVDAVASTVTSRSINEYKDSCASGKDISVGFKSIFGASASSQHSSTLSRMSQAGTYAYRTTRRIKVLRMHTKGNLEEYVNKDFIREAQTLPLYNESVKKIKKIWENFFSKWGGPFYVSSGIWGGLIDATTTLSNADEWESSYSSSNVAASVGASLGPWAAGGGISSSSESAYSDSSFMSSLKTQITVIGGQPEGNHGHSNQITINVLNWGNEEYQEHYRDVKLAPSLISFKVKKISSLFTGSLQSKMDDGIDGIFGKKENDLYSLNSKFNKFETDTNIRIVEISDKLSDIDVPTKGDILGGQCSYYSIQNPLTSPTTGVQWRYKKCPDNWYVCAIGVGWEHRWEARFFKLGCCQ